MLLVYFFAVLPKKNDGEKTVSFSVVYADCEYKYDNITTNAKTVYELIVEIDEKCELQAEISDTAYGKYLSGLKGTAENSTDRTYYIFMVNGEFSNFGIDTQTVNDNDKIEFRYITYSLDYSSNTLANKN